MRHAQQIQRPGLADTYQLGKELCRVVDMFDDLGGDHPGGGSVGNRQRIAVRHVTFDVPRRGVAQSLAGGFDLGAVDIGNDDLRPAHPAKMYVTAIPAADIQQYVFSRHREAFEQFAGFLVEPATELRIVKAKHVGISFVDGCNVGRCNGRRRRRHCAFLQKAQHEVAPEDETAARDAPRRATRSAPRLRMGISIKR